MDRVKGTCNKQRKACLALLNSRPKRPFSTAGRRGPTRDREGLEAVKIVYFHHIASKMKKTFI